MEAADNQQFPEDLDPLDAPDDASWSAALEGFAQELEAEASYAETLAAHETDEPADPLGALIAAIDAAIAADVGANEELPPAVADPRRGYLLFGLAGERYAAPMDRVAEVDRVAALTPTPNTPDFVLGVANVRGQIVPAFELRRLFGLPPAERPEAGRMMQLRGLGEGWIAGAVVDSLHGIRAFHEAEMLRQGRADEPGASLLAGFYDDNGEALRVLDVDRLFACEAIRALTD